MLTRLRRDHEPFSVLFAAKERRMDSAVRIAMLKTFVAVSMLLALWSTAECQNGVPSGGRLNKEKPAVYIDVDCQNATTFRLRLYNNTDWPITIPTYSFYFNPKNAVAIKLKNGPTVFPLPSDRDISSVYYYVEKDTDQKIQVPVLNYPDSFNQSWIVPRGSIRFTVPKEHLKEGLRIFISFNYEWELSYHGVILNDVQHRVFFRSITLRNLDAPTSCHD